MTDYYYELKVVEEIDRPQSLNLLSIFMNLILTIEFGHIQMIGHLMYFVDHHTNQEQVHLVENYQEIS